MRSSRSAASRSACSAAAAPARARLSRRRSSRRAACAAPARAPGARRTRIRPPRRSSSASAAACSRSQAARLLSNSSSSRARSRLEALRQLGEAVSWALRASSRCWASSLQLRVGLRGQASLGLGRLQVELLLAGAQLRLLPSAFQLQAGVDVVAAPLAAARPRSRCRPQRSQPRLAAARADARGVAVGVALPALPEPREVHRRQAPHRVVVMAEARDVGEPALQVLAIVRAAPPRCSRRAPRGLEQLQRQQREEQDAERRLGEALDGLEVRHAGLGRAVAQRREALERAAKVSLGGSAGGLLGLDLAVISATSAPARRAPLQRIGALGEALVAGRRCRLDAGQALVALRLDLGELLLQQLGAGVPLARLGAVALRGDRRGRAPRRRPAARAAARSRVSTSICGA
jgi:hypothetical protein